LPRPRWLIGKKNKNKNFVSVSFIPSKRGGLSGDTLLETAVTHNDVGVVVDHVEAGLVEDRGEVGLGDGKTDSVGDALAERAGGDLDAVSVASLGMAGGPLLLLIVRIEMRL